MTEQTIHSVELARDLHLEYLEGGSPEGLPVLFLHGLSDSCRSFEPVMSALPENVRAIAPSQRGHGDSSRPEHGYSFRDYAADAEAFLRALDIAEAVIVGHSLGSGTAQRFAVEHPDRTRALVLIGSAPAMASVPALEELRKAVDELEDPVDPEFVRDFQASTLAKPVQKEYFETIVSESLKLPARVWRAAVAGAMEGDTSRELDRILAPTLLVWGDRDELFTREDQATLQEAIPDARLLVYAGAGHGTHWEEPERFADDLMNFISRIVSG